MALLVMELFLACIDPDMHVADSSEQNVGTLDNVLGVPLVIGAGGAVTSTTG